MKLKELENLVNGIGKQEKIILETEANILGVRNEIDVITALVGTQRKRNQSSLLNKKQEKMSNTQRDMPVEARMSTPLPASSGIPNDKNKDSGN